MREPLHERYDDAFRRGALALLERSRRPLKAVAEDLGIPPATLRYWYKSGEMVREKKRAAAKKGGAALIATQPLSEQERIAQLEAEVAALRKENDELKMDRAILKKAAAFFAKE